MCALLCFIGQVMKPLNLFFFFKANTLLNHNLFCPVTKNYLTLTSYMNLLARQEFHLFQQFQTQINIIKHETYHIHKGRHSRAHSYFHKIEHAQMSSYLQIFYTCKPLDLLVHRRVIVPSLCTKHLPLRRGSCFCFIAKKDEHS